MTTTKNYWAISKKSNVLVPFDVDTKASTYPVVEYKAFRKFGTRSAARDFKQGLRSPRNYCIINTKTGTVVR